MRKFPLKAKQLETRTITAITRQRVIQILKELNFVQDVEGNDILIFRCSNFPFQRLALPKDDLISIELIKEIADDFKWPYDFFLPEIHKTPES